MHIIITSPSLDPTKNVSGISAVTQFIIRNNPNCHYTHFELGKKDNERGGIYRIKSLMCSLMQWHKLLSHHKDSVIHYNFPLSKQSIIRDPFFMAVARWHNIPMLLHLHGGNFLTDSHVPSFLNCILKKVFAMKCPVVVLSEMERELVKNRYGCKQIEVLPNCVDLHEAQLFNRVCNTHKPLVTGYLGRIAETKGMEELLQAFVELKKQGIPFVLKLAGKEEIEGKYLPRFEKALGNQFKYEGVVSGATKDNFLKSLDVFMLPSYFEGLPMSLLECMSFGVVPVVTNVGSIGEIVKERTNGCFIKVKDARSIVDTLKTLNQYRVYVTHMSTEAKKTIFSTFSPEHYVERLNIIYQSVNPYQSCP